MDGGCAKIGSGMIPQIKQRAWCILDPQCGSSRGIAVNDDRKEVVELLFVQ